MASQKISDMTVASSVADADVMPIVQSSDNKQAAFSLIKTYLTGFFSKFSFKTISVSGQSDVVADSDSDTLTLVAGTNMSLTTNASTDTITITSTAGGGNVSNSGTPTVGQMAQWIDATDVKGVTLSGSGATISINTSGVLAISAIANATLSNSAITIAGTSTALGGSITLDTIDNGVSSVGLINRTGANTRSIVTAPSGAIVGTTDTQTLTNKRVTKRVTSTSGPGATPTINTDNCDAVHLTALGTAITSMTTNLSGTPVQGDTLRIDFTDDGTARGITWGASFEASTVALPTTTVISTRLDVGFIWNTVTTKWRCVAVA